MDYAEMVQALLILTSRASAANNYVPPADFTNILPRAIEYAEDRIYREMVFLATRAQDASLTFSGNTRSLNLASATTIIIVPEGLSIITPVGSIPALGTRRRTLWTSLDMIDFLWPTESLTADPTDEGIEFCWSLKDDQTLVVAPTPDNTYPAEITGLFQPARISTTNTTTYISLQYPDLMIAAGMVFLSGYLRNFGAQADAPQMSQSWETQYSQLRASATLEEQRRRGAGSGWSQNMPTPLAQPQRTG